MRTTVTETATFAGTAAQGWQRSGVWFSQSVLWAPEAKLVSPGGQVRMSKKQTKILPATSGTQHESPVSSLVGIIMQNAKRNILKGKPLTL